MVCTYVWVGYSCELSCVCVGVSEGTNAARCFNRIFVGVSYFFATVFFLCVGDYSEGTKHYHDIALGSTQTPKVI